MNIKLRQQVIIFAILATFIAPSTAVAIPYTLVDLGPVDEALHSPLLEYAHLNESMVTNSSGQTIVNPEGSGAIPKIVNSDGTFRELLPPDGFAYNHVYAINNHGDAVGSSTTAETFTSDHSHEWPGNTIATLWRSNGEIVPLWPWRGNYSEASLITDAGVVTGGTIYDGVWPLPAVWIYGETVDFDSLMFSQGFTDQGWVINRNIGVYNDNLIVVGARNDYFFTADHAFLVMPATLADEPIPISPLPEPGLLSLIVIGMIALVQVSQFRRKREKAKSNALVRHIVELVAR
jgi:hypothetical protein